MFNTWEAAETGMGKVFRKYIVGSGGGYGRCFRKTR
jgi:hypothetical protein